MKPRTIGHLDHILLLDSRLASVERIARRVQSLSLARRRLLLRLAQRSLDREPSRSDERARVSAAKTLVALLPESEAVIRRWLSRFEGRAAHEIHFSLFCFLDEVPALPGTRAIARKIPALVEQYLGTVRSNTALAAWMAGHFLGEHWRRDEALPVLLRVATSGRHVAGRLGALSALDTLLSRTSGRARRMVLQCFRDVSRSDRSEEMRARAAAILREGVRGSRGRARRPSG
jgi:hypothetical protein